MSLEDGCHACIRHLHAAIEPYSALLSGLIQTFQKGFKGLHVRWHSAATDNTNSRAIGKSGPLSATIPFSSISSINDST